MNIYDLNTTGEIISYGVVVTIQGIMVVFLILILIMLTIYAMGLFSGDKKVKKEVVTEAPVAPSMVEDAVDEGELIAVLTAAVAACLGTSQSSVNIRSYKKVSSAWGNAAKREVLEKF